MRVAGQSIDAGRNDDRVYLEGFASPEASGRWSISKEPRLRFYQPLPAELTLRLSGHAFASNVGQDIVVRIAGGSSQAFRFLSTDSTQEVRLTNPWLASAITLVIPDPQSPKRLGFGDDERELGIALTGFEVRP
jgi:phosphoglycerol transferase